jgi:hypothetical protein
MNLGRLLGKRLKRARSHNYGLEMTDAGINIFCDLALISSETGDMIMLYVDGWAGR